MEQNSNPVDVESLKSNERRRGTCVDVFLGISVLILFLAVTALGVGGMLMVKELRSEHQVPPPMFDHLKAGDSLGSYKGQNIAYLKPAKSHLDNFTIPWRPVKFGEGTSVGKNYEYDSTKRSLKPANEGFYFIYIQVTVSCTHKCSAGILKLDVLEKLTCSVELTADVEKSPVSKKCWTVSRLSGEELIAHMTVPKNGLTNWSLDLNASHFGMFLVD